MVVGRIQRRVLRRVPKGCDHAPVARADADDIIFHDPEILFRQRRHTALVGCRAGFLRLGKIRPRLGQAVRKE